MDEREWKDSKLIVEINATANSIISGIDTLFDIGRDGLKLDISEGKLAVIEFQEVVDRWLQRTHRPS